MRPPISAEQSSFWLVASSQNGICIIEYMCLRVYLNDRDRGEAFYEGGP